MHTQPASPSRLLQEVPSRANPSNPNPPPPTPRRPPVHIDAAATRLILDDTEPLFRCRCNPPPPRRHTVPPPTQNPSTRTMLPSLFRSRQLPRHFSPIRRRLPGAINFKTKQSGGETPRFGHFESSSTKGVLNCKSDNVKDCLDETQPFCDLWSEAKKVVEETMMDTLLVDEKMDGSYMATCSSKFSSEPFSKEHLSSQIEKVSSADDEQDQNQMYKGRLENFMKLLDLMFVFLLSMLA